MSNGKRPKASISQDDRELFRTRVGAVCRLQSDRVQPPKGTADTRPRHTEASELRVMQELAEEPLDWSQAETGEELVYLGPGMQSRVLRRLRRGHYRVVAELDLHEMNATAATESIMSFITRSRDRGQLCVKIIHGKGLKSKHGGPVLKRLTDSLLRRRSEVLAFASATPIDGGTGAVYVLLRRA